MGCLVAARAESFLASSREHDHANGTIPAGALERIDQLIDGLAAKHIVPVGPVDRDARDALESH